MKTSVRKIAFLITLAVVLSCCTFTFTACNEEEPIVPKWEQYIHSYTYTSIEVYAKEPTDKYFYSKGIFTPDYYDIKNYVPNDRFDSEVYVFFQDILLRFGNLIEIYENYVDFPNGTMKKTSSRFNTQFYDSIYLDFAQGSELISPELEIDITAVNNNQAQVIGYAWAGFQTVNKTFVLGDKSWEIQCKFWYTYTYLTNQ